MNTHFITTTQLREHSSKVVARLISGEDVTLVHRSKIIGVIKPLLSFSKPIENLEEFKKALIAVKPKKLITFQNRNKIYREHFKKRYG